MAEAGARVTVTTRQPGPISGLDTLSFRDFNSRETIAEMFRDYYLHYNNWLDVLVLTHGMIYREPAKGYNISKWDEILEVNLTSYFLIAQKFYESIKTYELAYVRTHNAKIIFVGSVIGARSGLGAVAYSTSKGAISALTTSLSNEWSKDKINVNALLPGWFESPLSKAAQDDEIRNQMILDRIPAERWGKPQDFVGPAIFLASQASDYMCGSLLTVDGGWSGR
jgi:2-deoxy-D-gluconate 3-dehydrogenase